MFYFRRVGCAANPLQNDSEIQAVRRSNQDFVERICNEKWLIEAWSGTGFESPCFKGVRSFLLIAASVRRMAT